MKSKKIGLLQMMMISVIAVDSIRTLPISAEFGPSLIFYYILCGLFFLLPCAYVCAELSSTWPETGGLYVWIKQAFGGRAAFISAWFLWVYNIIWFPTIMAFICQTLVTVFFPQAKSQSLDLVIFMWLLFWLLTGLNLFGVKVSSWISTVTAIIGTLLPMAVIIALGWFWLYQGRPMAIDLSWSSVVPDLNFHSMGMLTGLLFGLVGIEVSASFAGDFDRPQRNFPISLFCSSLIILASLILGSLAIAVVIPRDHLNLATGVIDAFGIFLKTFGLSRYLSWIAVAIFLGSLGGLSAWMAGPTRNLMRAAQEGDAPSFFAKANRYGASSGLLLIQGLVFSILSLVFVVVHQFNHAYWLLSAITSQLSILVYLMIFASAIFLRYQQKHKPRPFQVPGGLVGMWLVAGLAFLTCVAVFILGFIPPDQLSIAHTMGYEITMVAGIVVTVMSGYWLSGRSSGQVMASPSQREL